MSIRKTNGGASALQLRRKQRTKAELVNEKLAKAMVVPGGRGKHSGADYDPFLAEDGEGMGVAEEFEWREGDDDDDANHGEGQYSRREEANATRGKRSRADSPSSPAAAVADRRQPAKKRKLRHRGPLDASLSEGKYTAKPVADVEAMMDDMFADLDMSNLDAEAEEDVYGSDEGSSQSAGGDEGAEGRGKQRRRRRVKDLTEEEYAAFLAEKRKKRRVALKNGSGLSLGAVDGEEGAILEQLESLRQAQVSLVKGAGEGEGGANRSDDAAAQAKTQEAVKHYIMLYAQLLRIRVKLQPAVVKAISIPQYYAKSLFTERQEELEEGDDDGGVGDPAPIKEAYAGVVSELRSLLGMLYSYVSPVSSAEARAAGGSSFDAPAPPTFTKLQQFHANHVKKKADACLAYWGSRLVQTNSAKLKTISQPLPQQIEAILANMPRLRHKTQKNRAHLPILAHPDHERAAAAAKEGGNAGDESVKVKNAEAALRRATVMAEGDVDEEIYDDSDFLRELVRRGGAAADRLERQLVEVNRETLPAREARKKGFHRKTKGKEVSYEPRPKLSGFLMSLGFENSGRNDVVLRSLFQ